MYATGNNQGFFGRPGRLPSLILALVGCLVLGIFIVDKLAVSPPPKTAAPSAVLAHLERHDVRRVTIPASTITLELNDGTRLTTDVPADRDLWPLIRRSGSDVTLVNGGSSSGGTPALFQFVPFAIMALLLIFILQRARRQPR
jgi:hypothetical protein